MFNFEDKAWFLKPFLISFLMIAVYFFESFKTKKILLLALTFSLIGDIILLFSDFAEIYFILGLIAFLISHVFYIILFGNQSKTNTLDNKEKFLLGIGFILIYFTFMAVTLVPKLGELTIPVSVYSVIICTMLLFALVGNFQWKRIPYHSVLIGAFFFVISDSILAFNKFHSPIPYASFFIMITYLIAQYGIVWGILDLNHKK